MRDIKICGITREEDAEDAIQAGVTHLGFVLVPNTPRHLTMERAAKLVERFRNRCITVCVVRNCVMEEMELFRRKINPDIFQLHGEESPEFAKRMHGVRIWKAFHLRTEHDLRNAAEYPAERIVADSDVPGSGRTGNRELSAKLARYREVMLAGGITPENAVEALEKSGAVGIDLSSGVESEKGIKDKNKIIQLMRNIRSMNQ